MDEFIADRDQEIFDHAENCNEYLHYIQGSVTTLYALLEIPLEARPEAANAIFATLAAITYFCRAATLEARDVAKLVSGVGA